MLGTRGTHGIHETRGTVAEIIKKAVIRGTCVPREIHMTTETENVERLIRKKSSIRKKAVAMGEPMAGKRVLVLKQGQSPEAKPETKPEVLAEVEEEDLNYQTRVY